VGKTMPYDGLPRQTLAFLRGLEADNARDWFAAHREEYERDWLAAGLDLVAALAGPASALRPPLLAVPKLNASLRRIFRDVRFSADKRPYEPRLHLILSTGTAFNKEPGVHLVIGAKGIGFGAGFYGFSPQNLDRFRQEMTEEGPRTAFLGKVAAAEAVGCGWDAPDLARVPKGFAGQGDWDHLLRRKHVVVRTLQDIPHPDWLFTPQAPAELARILAALNPLAQDLRRFLD
jgi:uncharacterized protein (TIGR02453 family)